MQRIDIDKISREVAKGAAATRRGEGKYRPTVIRVPVWLIVVALVAVIAMAAHG